MKEPNTQLEEELRRNTFLLQERIKEQRCLLQISRLSTVSNIPLETIFDTFVSYLVHAWQFPEKTCVRIVYNTLDVRSENYSEPDVKITQTLWLNNRQTGRIIVGYRDISCEEGSSVFLKEELDLLEAVGELVESILEKKRQERIIRRTTRELRKRSRDLEERNLVLREVLNQIENEKNELKSRISRNIRMQVFPLIQNMKQGSLSRENVLQHIEMIERNLMDIDNSLSKVIMDKKLSLSPREEEICVLIRNGLQSKEISQMLNISILTVERHRFNIRKKLDLHKENVNLQTFLQQM